MKIIVRNHESRVVESSRDYIKGSAKSPLRAVKEFLNTFSDNYQESERFKAGKWDGKLRIINSEGIFPTGFVKPVVKLLDKAGHEIEIIDERDNAFTFGKPKLKGLLKYQKPIVKKIIKGKFSEHLFYRGLVDAATNTGKTYIMKALIKSAPGDIKVLILVHTVDLYNQLIDFFSEDWEVGFIGDNKIEIKRITVALYKTLNNRVQESVNVRRYLNSVNMLFVDESHNAGASTYKKLIKIINAYSIVFYSGTALYRKKKSENLSLIGMSGPKVSKISKKFLMDNNHSTKYVVYFYENPGSRFGSAKRRYETQIIKSKRRLSVIKNNCEKHTKILISVTRKEHGEFLKDNIPGAVTVYGTDSKKDRADKVALFKSGDIKIIITTVFREGLNSPGIDCLITAQGGMNIKDLNQLGGRLERLSHVTKATIIDFNDHGFPTHVRERKAYYNKEGIKIKIIED